MAIEANEKVCVSVVILLKYNENINEKRNTINVMRETESNLYSMAQCVAK